MAHQYMPKIFYEASKYPAAPPSYILNIRSLTCYPNFAIRFLIFHLLFPHFLWVFPKFSLVLLPASYFPVLRFVIPDALCNKLLSQFVIIAALCNT